MTYGITDGIADIEYDACSESGNSSESDDLDISISKDIDDLIDSCHELHANIIVANNILSNITDKVNKIQSINIIYEGEKIDFYDLLELLHKNAIKNIITYTFNNVLMVLIIILG